MFVASSNIFIPKISSGHLITLQTKTQETGFNILQTEFHADACADNQVKIVQQKIKEACLFQ